MPPSLYDRALLGTRMLPSLNMMAAFRLRASARQSVNFAEDELTNRIFPTCEEQY